MKHFSPAADNNKDHILQALLPYLLGDLSVLEIGSGSGQHALHLAQAMPNLKWQPTERGAGLPYLVDNIAAYGSDNISPPVLLELADDIWPVKRVDRIYSANVLHIVPEVLGERLLRNASKVLSERSFLMLYGPFKYAGRFTTPSNAQFDQWLKARNPKSGVRDFEWVEHLASQTGLHLTADLAMPANNQLLIFGT
jgi:cyclopropane fatty-acyl-phospholipid synthase-like methyltransferase